MKKIKTVFNFVESDGGKPARMDLYGFIGSISWDDSEQSVTAKAVGKTLSQIQGDAVDVHINSYGGDAFEGIGIYNALKQSGKKINIYIDAIAASAASLIAMSGDTIFMPKNSQLMVHRALTNVYGNVDDLQKAIDMLNTMGNSLIQTYMTRFTGSQDELEELLEAETFLSADEAIAMGLADEIVNYDDDQEEPDPEPKADIKARLVAKYIGAGRKIELALPAAEIEEPKPEPHKKSFAEKLASLS